MCDAHAPIASQQIEAEQRRPRRVSRQKNRPLFPSEVQVVIKQARDVAANCGRRYAAFGGPGGKRARLLEAFIEDGFVIRNSDGLARNRA